MFIVFFLPHCYLSLPRFSQALVEAEGRIEGLQQQLDAREREIAVYSRQVLDLSAQVAANQADMEHCRQIQATIQADLDANKDLCSKLDTEKDKLKDELNECSSIRRQLEQDNERLRVELVAAASKSKIGDKAGIESMQQLLAKARADLEAQRKLNAADKGDLERLRRTVDDLQVGTIYIFLSLFIIFSYNVFFFTG